MSDRLPSGAWDTIPAPPTPRSSAVIAAACDHPISPADLRWVVDFVQRECGLVTTTDKHYLLQSRLASAAVTLGLPSLQALVAQMRSEQHVPRGGRRPAILAACDALTTNETLFFRDGHPFAALREAILPPLAEGRLRDAAAKGDGRAPEPIRVWSAACSTGQEPYSIAMCAALAAPQLGGVGLEVFASDLSERALERAREASYSDFEARRGLEPAHVARFFAREGATLRVVPAIRRLVRFERRNLLDPPADAGPFDVVFCRNVLLYFDAVTRLRVLEAIATVMRPGALLLLGGTETPPAGCTRFARGDRGGALVWVRTEG